MSATHAFFAINLVQDLNILRPLVLMAASDLGYTCELLVTPMFYQRDRTGIWREELTELARAARADIVEVADAWAARCAMQGKTGYLLAGSESDLNAHRPVHEWMRVAPRGILTVTLQHGYECVGFLQSRDQDLAHGKTVRFGAQIICGWAPAAQLKSTPLSEAHKLFVAGPTAVLQRAQPGTGRRAAGLGLVCENMHSPRLSVAGDFKQDFYASFASFCAELASRREQVALRPHPGGQYLLKNGVALPDNVVQVAEPIYKVDLSQFSYAISAPSSILIDSMLAGVPTAVWQDPSSTMDMGNYAGLHHVSTPAQWLAFCEDARRRPEHYRALQAEFLHKTGLLLDPAVVGQRYRALLTARPGNLRPPLAAEHRVMIVANGNLPTLQLSFKRPLAEAVRTGRVVIDLVTDEDLLAGGVLPTQAETTARVARFDPTVLVFCRYSGPLARHFMEIADSRGLPTVYQIDDDLLAIPEDIGLAKHRHHSAPARLDAVRYLLERVALVYCSTPPLAARLREHGINTPIYQARIYCAGSIIREAENRPVTTVGYMASADHAHNLTPLVPALCRFLESNPQVHFEFFGSIPIPPPLAAFGARVRHAPKITDYETFLQRFSERGWDIGICPLAPITFNLVKANTKWVEYTSAGAAVVAAANTVYDESCSGGAGIVANTEQDWLLALQGLVDAPEERYRMVKTAQDKIRADYTLAKLEQQVFALFTAARTAKTDGVTTVSSTGL